MTHTFFETNSNFTVASISTLDQFIVEVSYAPESNQLELVYDPSTDDFENLQEKLLTGEWEHFVLKVAAVYDEVEIHAEYLGSCLSEDPVKWIELDVDGIVAGMISVATREATLECQARLAKLTTDFG